MSLFAPRAELLITFSAEEQARVRSLLAQNHVDYRLKVVDRSAPSPLSTGRRGRTGSFGESPALACEYIFTVRKEDLSLAQAVLSARFGR